ncbi:MAG: hypothetical protein EHM55_00860 [Acidobacteria bacterium]|nr:MAG: hypothetical protein EHM55_00860 [Acidobacteriota bacterium]
MSSSRTPNAAAMAPTSSKVRPNSGLRCVIQTKCSLSPVQSSVTGVGPMFNPKTQAVLPGARRPSRARANVLPTTGWPAMGISVPVVKIRMRTSLSARSAGVTNVVSAKPISRAICCMVRADNPLASGNTASWLPPKRRSVNTS